MRAFTRRCASIGLVSAALALPICMGDRLVAQVTHLVATSEHPARIPTPIPRAAERFLIVYVSAYVPPQRGSVEWIVTIGKTGNETLFGVIAVFPSEPFVAKSPADLHAYRLAATDEVLTYLSAHKDDPLIVEIRAASAGSDASTSGAELAVSHIEFSSG